MQPQQQHWRCSPIFSAKWRTSRWLKPSTVTHLIFIIIIRSNQFNNDDVSTVFILFNYCSASSIPRVLHKSLWRLHIGLYVSPKLKSLFRRERFWEQFWYSWPHLYTISPTFSLIYYSFLVPIFLCYWYESDGINSNVRWTPWDIPRFHRGLIIFIQ